MITIYEALKVNEALEKIYNDNITIMPFNVAYSIKKICNEIEILGNVVADMLDECHNENFLNDELVEIQTYGLTLSQLLSVNDMCVNTADIGLIAKLLPTN